MSAGASEATIEKVRADLTRAMNGTVGVRHPPSEVLDGALQAALDAASLVHAPEGGLDQPQFERLALDLPADLRAWLLELPSFLAKKGREPQGEQLCDRYLPILGPAYMESERAIVLLEAGRKEAARAHMDSCRSRFPDHPWVLLRHGFLRQRSGDPKGAQHDYEAALERARERADRSDLRLAFDALVQFHQERGDSATAMKIGREMLDELPEIESEFKTEQLVRDAPKVGRNDPCPCGSGSKFKKCCGR